MTNGQINYSKPQNLNSEIVVRNSDSNPIKLAQKISNIGIIKKQTC